MFLCLCDGFHPFSVSTLGLSSPFCSTLSFCKYAAETSSAGALTEVNQSPHTFQVLRINLVLHGDTLLWLKDCAVVGLPLVLGGLRCAKLKKNHYWSMYLGFKTNTKHIYEIKIYVLTYNLYIIYIKGFIYVKVWHTYTHSPLQLQKNGWWRRRSLRTFIDLVAVAMRL